MRDGKRESLTFHPLTSMRPTLIDTWVRTQKKERRRDLQPGENNFLGINWSTKKKFLFLAQVTLLESKLEVLGPFNCFKKTPKFFITIDMG